LLTPFEGQYGFAPDESRTHPIERFAAAVCIGGTSAAAVLNRYADSIKGCDINATMKLSQSG
jgi:hypothetical protein